MRTGIELFLFFIGIPAFFLGATLAPDYIENWLSAEDRKEQRKLYSIIGDQEVSKIATKYISGSMVCIDSFNDTELPMEYEKVWIRAQDKIEEAPLDAVMLFTGGDAFPDNGFSKSVPPTGCMIKNEELHLSMPDQQRITAICERKAKVSSIVSQSVNSHFTIRNTDGDYLNGAYVETRYDVDCDLKVTSVRDCLPRNYGDKLASIRQHEYHFGAFTEYNYCDNPENAEFKRQVLDRWSRAAQNTD